VLVHHSVELDDHQPPVAARELAGFLWNEMTSD
jgi:hypothetical protein